MNPFLGLAIMSVLLWVNWFKFAIILGIILWIYTFVLNNPF